MWYEYVRFSRLGALAPWWLRRHARMVFRREGATRQHAPVKNNFQPPRHGGRQDSDTFRLLGALGDLAVQKNGKLFFNEPMAARVQSGYAPPPGSSSATSATSGVP